MAGEVPYNENGRFFSNSTVSVLRTLDEAKQLATNERQQATAKRLAIYRDDWKELLLAKLREQFKQVNYDEIKKVVDVSNNPLKRVIDEQSNVYCKPAQWAFSSPNPLWADLLDDVQAPIVFPEINRLTNLCNEVFVYVAPCGKTLRLHVITPDNLIAWQDSDDPTRAIAIAYRQTFADTIGARPRWHYWSRGENPVHEIMEGDLWDPARAKILVREPNPYVDEDGLPVLPGQMRHRVHPTLGIFNASAGDDLYELTLLIGCLETWINHLIRTDSARIKYATGALDERGGGVASTQGVIQFVPVGDGTISVGEFASQSDWNGLGGQITRKLQNALANYGMSLADFQITGDPQSGFALRVRKEGLIERREQQIPLYKAYDEELYGIVAAVWNFEITNANNDLPAGLPQLPWPSQVEPSVSYARYQVPQAAQEQQLQQQIDQIRLSMGLVSVVDLVRLDHPEMTADEAEQFLKDNLELNKKYLPNNELVAGRAQVLPVDGSAAPAPAQGVPPQGGAPAPAVDHKKAVAGSIAALVGERIAAQKAKADQKT